MEEKAAPGEAKVERPAVVEKEALEQEEERVAGGRALQASRQAEAERTHLPVENNSEQKIFAMTALYNNKKIVVPHKEKAMPDYDSDVNNPNNDLYWTEGPGSDYDDDDDD